MNITVQYIEERLNCRFVPRYGKLHLWITDNNPWYKSVGWCPHLNIGGGECHDCALVLEDEEDEL